MNAMTTAAAGGSLTLPPAKNAFETYADSVSSNRLVGDRLKYDKGDWLAGQDAEEIAMGTRLVAAASETMVGWIRWADNKPTDVLMGRVADGFMPAARRDLGDLDESGWEVNQENQPKDPWQLTSYVILKEEKGDRLFTYAPSSAGGRNVVGALIGEYGKHLRTKPNEFPIVALGTDSYMHKDRSRGRIKVPVLKVVGWVDQGATMAAIAGDAADAEADAQAEAEREETPAPAAPAKAGGRGKAAPSGETRF